MITVDDYLWGWKAKHSNCIGIPDDDILKNAQITVDRANQLLEECGLVRDCNSGWRPEGVNEAVGGSKHSKHLIGAAIDIADPGGVLDSMLSNSENNLLEELGLWRESPDKTVGWVHLQIEPYGSWHPGKSRTFQP